MGQMQDTKSTIKEVFFTVIISLAVIIPIRMYIAQPFIVSGDSMDNTFRNGQYLIVDEISYRFHAPQRGDVLIFKIPPEAVEISAGVLGKNIYFIKRIIGLPGETVQINGNDVIIFNTANPNGMKLTENYTLVNKLIPTKNLDEKITLKDNEYFVMGDNRNNSSDSRYWGPLSGNLIKGRPLVRLWPFNLISLFPGKVNY